MTGQEHTVRSKGGGGGGQRTSMTGKKGGTLAGRREEAALRFGDNLKSLFPAGREGSSWSGVRWGQNGVAFHVTGGEKARGRVPGRV